MVTRNLPSTCPIPGFQALQPGTARQAPSHFPEQALALSAAPTMLTGSFSTLPGAQALHVTFALVTIFSHPLVPHPDFHKACRSPGTRTLMMLQVTKLTSQFLTKTAISGLGPHHCRQRLRQGGSASGVGVSAWKYSEAALHVQKPLSSSQGLRKPLSKPSLP